MNGMCLPRSFMGALRLTQKHFRIWSELVWNKKSNIFFHDPQYGRHHKNIANGFSKPKLLFRIGRENASQHCFFLLVIMCVLDSGAGWDVRWPSHPCFMGLYSLIPVLSLSRGKTRLKDLLPQIFLSTDPLHGQWLVLQNSLDTCHRMKGGYFTLNKALREFLFLPVLQTLCHWREITVPLSVPSQPYRTVNGIFFLFLLLLCVQPISERKVFCRIDGPYSRGSWISASTLALH